MCRAVCWCQYYMMTTAMPCTAQCAAGNKIPYSQLLYTIIKILIIIIIAVAAAG